MSQKLETCPLCDGEVVDEHGQVLTVSSWSVVSPDFDAVLRAAYWKGLPPEVRRRAASVTA